MPSLSGADLLGLAGDNVGETQTTAMRAPYITHATDEIRKPVAITGELKQWPFKPLFLP